MAQIKKVVEEQVEIKCNADKFFDVWGRKATQISNNLCPNIPKVELVQGDNCHTPGSVLSWTFVSPAGGKLEYLNTLLEDIDEKKRSLTYKVTEGEMLNKYYHIWRETVEIIPKGENCSTVKWSVIECEKKHETAPDPKLYVDFCLKCVQDIARNISSA